MKIFFVTTYNARDIRNWSGTPYYLSKSFIDAGIEVEFISNLKSLTNKFLPFRIKYFLFNKFLKEKLGTYESYYEPRNLKFIASQVQKVLRKKKDGIVFSPGAIPIAYLNTNKPIVLWTDATFAVMHNYYEDFKKLNKTTVKNCHLYEKKVLNRSNLAIFSSQWAADSSVKDYGADREKVKVIPYGANIEAKRTINDIIENNREKSRSICKLLFVGQDWKRKGAETAIKITEDLNKQNINTELTIVGCLPPENSPLLPDFVHVLGFIDKSNRKGESLINKLYSESHFFILPTIAECTPIVFSEANSFGLPVITTNTGGISSIIKNDVNGRMFSSDMDIFSCALYIGKFFKNYDQYESFSLKSFNEYETTLNWKVAINKCISHMKNLEKDSLNPKASIA
jgi:glycosyltransferase involved in cell wall biosynthesis